LKESKKVLDLKNSALGKNGGSQVASSQKFKLHHLILIGVIGMLVGAYAQLYYFSGR
jgi:hypothetical protein